MLAKRLIKSNDAGGGGACTNTVDLYNPFPDGGGVALYQLNGDATDVSGNYDGTATNVTYGTGVFGQAGVFNGTSSYIDLPSNSLNFLTTYSMSAWINSSNSVTGAIAANWGWPGSGAELGWLIRKMNDNKIRVTNSNGTIQNYNSTGTIPLNTWTNVVITNTQSEIKIYINGSLDSTHSSSGFTVNAGYPMNPLIGAYKYQSTYDLKFTGSIDQVRIFNRALRPYEVEALYTEEYCTPTIVPSEHFNTVTYVGDQIEGRQVTGVGFQPDLVWFKNRETTNPHELNDSVRGAGYRLFSNTTGVESFSQYTLSSFDSDGFTVGLNDNGNGAGENIVAWNFKAGGSAVTNTDGTITSQVSANTEAGFSVVSYTGNGLSNQTIGHGLGQTPDMIITKGRANLSTYDGWDVWHKDLTLNYVLFLNSNAAEDFAGVDQRFVTSLNSDTVFGLGPDVYGPNSNTTTKIAYCFAEVEGFSNFGSYVGTGTNTNTIVTGFEPAFIMFKNTTYGNIWTIVDNKRNISDPRNLGLFPSSSQVEYTFPGTPDGIKFLSNGFALNTATPEFNQPDVGNSGGEYIYMAFAADPTTIEPSLEDSFNTVTYTGTGASRSITGVGFQPDFTWIKGRNDPTDYHNLFDSVRGADKVLISNLTNAEYNGGGSAYFPSFDADGFSLSGNSIVNGNTQTYVAWNWKGAEIPAINSNGSIKSVVSANPAAGFSIVSYTGNGANATIGHGLGVAPSIYIIKNRDAAIDWAFETTLIDGSLDYLFLNSTGAKGDAVEAVPNETIFNIDGSIYLGANNNKFIAYCFAEVAGFSKFGIYVGANPSSVVVNTGFDPAFVLIKRASAAGASWVLWDNKRDTTNPRSSVLLPDTNDAEITASTLDIDFNSDGFEVKGSDAGINGNGSTFIYMAFANQF
jgi:hypothetical protein